VHGAIRGVQHQVGYVTQRLQHGTLCGDAVGQPSVALQRMGAPDVLEAADQHVVVCLEEENPGLKVALAEVGYHAGEVGGKGAATHIHHDGQLGDRTLTAAAQIDHRCDQLRRQVVDHEEPEVFQTLGRGAPAGT
jgi:hypothetical protein